MLKFREHLLWAVLLLFSSWTAAQECPPLLDFEVKPLMGGEAQRLCERYSGKVILVVNTASKCAFTPQFEGLEKLYAENAEAGLMVLGFPSGDFANQELNQASDIQNFCRLNYGVNFPMFAKVHVKGAQAHPFFKALAEAADQQPRWNFHKYLIGRNGQLIDHFYSWTGPESGKLKKAVADALSATE